MVQNHFFLGASFFLLGLGPGGLEEACGGVCLSGLDLDFVRCAIPGDPNCSGLGSGVLAEFAISGSMSSSSQGVRESSSASAIVSNFCSFFLKSLFGEGFGFLAEDDGVFGVCDGAAVSWGEVMEVDFGMDDDCVCLASCRGPSSGIGCENGIAGEVFAACSAFRAPSALVCLRMESHRV